MKIGDLVVYDNPRWEAWIGVIVRQIPGTAERQVIRWIDGSTGSYPKRELRVVNEYR